MLGIISHFHSRRLSEFNFDRGTRILAEYIDYFDARGVFTGLWIFFESDTARYFE